MFKENVTVAGFEDAIILKFAPLSITEDDKYVAVSETEGFPALSWDSEYPALKFTSMWNLKAVTLLKNRIRKKEEESKRLEEANIEAQIIARDIAEQRLESLILDPTTAHAELE